MILALQIIVAVFMQFVFLLFSQCHTEEYEGAVSSGALDSYWLLVRSLS